MLHIILASQLFIVNAQTHFIPAFEGNGQDHMNIYLIGATVEGVSLVAGDEVAAFDGNICCGVFVLTEPIDYTLGSLGIIKASRADGELLNGFTSGNSIRIKFWDSSAGKEYKPVNLIFYGTSSELMEPVPYSSGESTFIMASYLNRPPVADAGADKTVVEGSLVTLDGTDSSDPDGDQITWLWTAPAGITLNSSSSSQTTFVAPEVTVETRYTFTLVVNDGLVDSDPSQVVITVVPEGVFPAKIFLQGGMVDTENPSIFSIPMRTTLNAKRMLPGQTYLASSGVVYTPPGQPYNIAPWNYNGNEGASYNSNGDPAKGSAGYPADVVDWVLVSLRTTNDANYQTVCQKAALLHNDGKIELLSGFTNCGADPAQSYYLVVEHRNHLLAMSHIPVFAASGSMVYDFTIQQSYMDPAKPSYVGQNHMGAYYAMYAGNGNQSVTPASDTDINSDDNSFWVTENGLTGYKRADYNLNGDTNSNDPVLWIGINGLTSGVIRK